MAWGSMARWRFVLAVAVVLIVCGLAACGGPREPSQNLVEVGLDRIAAGEDWGLEDKRLGLIVHAASVSSDGRHAIDVLQGAGLEVVRLLTPEHGLRSRAAAGEHVASGTDAQSGLPVISLYGDHHKPTPEDLQGLDALVFDLQSAGVRFYTYVSTLVFALEAAGEADIELVVLDRPNPLGGERIEGPVSAPREVVAASFVNLAPGPLVHGLTIGEMARYVNQTLGKPARLSVVPMSGWRRSMVWADTGLLWVPPSPNLRSPEAAYAYPGSALLEATNLSEGRGTENPFLIFGAPWFRSGELAVVEPGFALRAAVFTPLASAAALAPKYCDQQCQGMTITVVDPAAVQPYRFGVSLLKAASAQPGFEWREDGAALTRLVGTPRLLQALREGRSIAEIVDADHADHQVWSEARKSALLY